MESLQLTGSGKRFKKEVNRSSEFPEKTEINGIQITERPSFDERKPLP